MIFHIFVLVFSLSFFTGCSLFKTKASSQALVDGEEYHEEEESGEQQHSEEEDSFDEDTDIVYIDEEEEMNEGGELEEEENPEEIQTEVSENEEDLGFDELDEDVEFSDTFTENQPPSDQGASSSATTASNKKTPLKKTWIPLKKIKSTPYFKEGFLVNAVYIAREGDTVESVSHKIFNSNKSAELHTINPHLKKRSVKVGDKIYYNSPHRKEDQNQLLFYYEDTGQTPQEHFAQAGQNIRQVSKELLGHSNSWKEIWATNPDLQSKNLLQRSISIKYWGTDAPAAPDAEEALPPLNAEENPQPPEEEALPPLPSEEENIANLNPDGTEDLSSSSPPEEALPLDSADEASPAMEGGGLSSLLKKDQAVWLGFAILVIVLIFIALIRRSRRRKEYDFAATNMEID